MLVNILGTFPVSWDNNVIMCVAQLPLKAIAQWSLCYMFNYLKALKKIFGNYRMLIYI